MTPILAALARFKMLRTGSQNVAVAGAKPHKLVSRHPRIPVTPVEAFDYPRSYAQFLEREPNYVVNFLRSKRIKCVPAKVEDMAQDLHLHLLTPTKKGLAMGLPDRVATYDPGLRGNATSRWAWAHWLNMILGREFNRLVGKDKRPGVEGPTVVSLDIGGAEGNKFLLDHEKDIFASESANELTANLCTKQFVANYLGYLEHLEGPEVASFARLYMNLGTAPEAAKALGIPISRTSTYLKIMAVAAAKYLKKNRHMRVA